MFFIFFFFQAEDGIRVDLVTGVQTCALPILDRPVLHSFVRELVEHERLTAFAEALPARARVSEPALPLVLAALHESLGRPLVVVLPEDADAQIGRASCRERGESSAVAGAC